MRGGKTMTYSKIKLYMASGIPEALSNIWYKDDSSVVEIEDAVEDASDSSDLLNRIKKLNLLKKNSHLIERTIGEFDSSVQTAGET